MSDKYYILDYASKNPKLANSLPKPTIDGKDYVNLDLGAKYLESLPTIKFTMGKDEYGELGDLVFTAFRGVILSDKFKQTLDAANVDNIDYYPASIEDTTTGILHENYFAANIIGKIDCMDTNKSQYTTMPEMPGAIDSIENFVVDHEKIHSEKIFLYAKLTYMIFVREDIKKIIEQAQLVGIEFVEAEGYATFF